MNKAVAGTIFSVTVLVAGSLYYATSGSLWSMSNKKVSRSDYVLTSGEEALVLVPDATAANVGYAEAAQLYLEPSGFDGIATVFPIPEPSNLVASIPAGVTALVQEVESQYTAGDFGDGLNGAPEPLYIFGYSEGAVVAGLAEQQLYADNIPTDDLHFVMIGDSASAEGGFLNTFVDSLPQPLQQPVTELLTLLDITAPGLGATTPDNLYQTDVYSLTGDGWADWDDGANIGGLLTNHLEYLGLTPAEIATVGAPVVDGLTSYYTIDSANVDAFSALWEALMVSLNIS